MSPLVIIYGHHMSGGTVFAPFAQYSSCDFAEGRRPIQVFTREKAIELEVFAVDVVDASAEGKRTDFADAAELDACFGDKLSRCEVVLKEPTDVEQAQVFVTCSYPTSNSRPSSMPRTQLTTVFSVQPVYTGNAFRIDNDQWLDRCSGPNLLVG